MLSVARKNPMPQIEIEICKRLRSARESLGVSRAYVAKKLEIGASRLSNFEHAAAPLRYGFVRQFCLICQISQRWLARGGPEGEMRRYIVIHPEIAAQISDRM